MDTNESPPKGPASTKGKLIMVGLAVAVLAVLLMAPGTFLATARAVAMRARQ